MSEFEAWIVRHRERHPFAKLPDLKTGMVMYHTWFADLHREKVADVPALDVASGRLVLHPARSDKYHFATLVLYAREALQSRGGRPTHDLSTHEGASAASAGCERGCGGTGMTVVWHPRPDPEKRIAETSAAYCVCALGRWIERNHAHKQPEIRKRIPDLKDVIEGRSEWLTEPPGLHATAGERGGYGGGR